jgi:hypothetical protein
MSVQLTYQESQDQTAAEASQAGRGWLRAAFHRLRLAIQEMNYASRRVVERQAPWIVDEQWHRK